MPLTDEAEAQRVADLSIRLRSEFHLLLEDSPRSHIYLLLDPNCPVAKHHGLHMDSLANRPLPRTRVAVLRPDFPNDPALCPQLIQLFVSGEHGWLDEALLDESIACAVEFCSSINGAYVCAWLISEADPPELARHIASGGVMLDMTQARTRFVPLFEPYRMALAHAITKPGGLDGWLGPATHWFFVDSAAQLKKVERVSEGSQLPKTSRLPREVFAAMAHMRQSRVVLLALKGMDEIPRGEPELRVDRAVVLAHEQGFRQTEDVVLHALNTLTIGPLWVTHPAARRALQLVTQGGHQTSLKSEFERLSDADLLDMERHAAQHGLSEVA